MARPRKDSGQAPARKRIMDAFWCLLSTTKFSSITVSAVVEKAGCNRGTFYRYFENVDNLFATVVIEDVLGSNLLSFFIFSLVKGVNTTPAIGPESCEILQRVGIIMRQGGDELVRNGLREMLLKLWTIVLCPDGSELKPEARATIEYSTGGLLDMLVWDAENHPECFESGEVYGYTLTTKVVPVFIDALCQAQGVQKDELLDRLQTLGQTIELLR